MSEIFLIGISGDQLSPEQQVLLGKCSAVALARRYERLVRNSNLGQIPIAPISNMVKDVAEHLELGDVAVLASGDPLFFGIGRILICRFGPERVRIFPALSAMQLACARFRIPWDDLIMMSLHGRDLRGVTGKIFRHCRVMLFTDHHNTPDRIASSLLSVLKEYGDRERSNNIRVRVAENLSLANERLRSGSLEKIASLSFGPLSMMLIEQEAMPENGPVFGLREDEIRHSRSLITKDEVRAVILHCLCLPARGVFWDVGGGSGSISLEAGMLAPELEIYTVEKKDEELGNIKSNIVRYNRYMIHAVAGEAPGQLLALPDPDRIFIGGSGGRLAEIIAYCADRLAPGGRMVASAVLKTTTQQAPILMHDNGLTVDIRTVTVTRRPTLASDEDRLNPITIITGLK